MLRAIDQLFQKRPLAIALFGFLVLLFLFLFLSLPYALPVAIGVATAGSLAAGALFFFRKSKAKTTLLPILLITLFLTAALLFAHGIARKEQKVAPFCDGSSYPATFTVTDLSRYSHSTWAKGYFTEIDGKPCHIQAKTAYYIPTVDGEDIAIADRITASFSFATARGETLGELQSFADGCLLVATAESAPDILSRGHHSFATRLAEMRREIGVFLENKLPDNAEAMLSAIVLADKSKLRSEVTEGFDTLGISHLLAVSGLHLTVTVGFFAYLLEKLRVRRAISCPILVAITLFYVSVTGFAPSMLRAGGMQLIFYLSLLVRRIRDPITSLLTAIGLIVCILPTSILDLGLLLSFAATAGILMIALPITQALRQRPFFRSGKLGAKVSGKLLNAAILTLAANLTVLPVLLLTDGSVFAFAVFSNLIFAPLFSLILWCLPLFLATCYVPYLSSAVTWCIEKLSALIFSLAANGSSLKAFQFSLSYPFMPFLILATLLLLLWLMLIKKKHLSALVPMTAFFLIACIGCGMANAALKNDETVCFHSNGKNDAISVSYGSMGLLIDFSQSSTFTESSFLATNPHNPTVENRALMLSSVRASHLPIIQALAERGKLAHLILPAEYELTQQLKSLAEGMDVAVTVYQTNEAILFEGIVITPYRHGGASNLSAVDVALTDKTILYVKENAPTQLDILFGPLASHRNVILYGGFGNVDPGCGPFDFHADTVVVGNRSNNVRHRTGVTYLDAPACFVSERSDDTE